MQMRMSARIHIGRRRSRGDVEEEGVEERGSPALPRPLEKIKGRGSCTSSRIRPEIRVIRAQFQQPGRSTRAGQWRGCEDLARMSPAPAGGCEGEATAAARGAGGCEDALFSELWIACAGPLVTVPKVGDKVFYFPQGHIEQVEASTNQVAEQRMQLYNLPWKILCEVMNVELKAKSDTDEVYAQLTLLPESKEQEEDTSTEEEVSATPSASPVRPRVHSFCKTLTTSDTSTHGGFSVLRRHADECLPPLDMSRQPPTQELTAKDLHGAEWRFRHIFRGGGQCYLDNEAGSV